MIALGTMVVVGCASDAQKAAADMPVTRVTGTQVVLNDQRDQLAPLSAGVAPLLSAGEVRERLLHSEKDNAAYLLDAGRLTVLLGSYSNPGLRDEKGDIVANVPSYVFMGGQAACPPSAGPYVPPTATPSLIDAPSMCTAVFIARAVDGATELISTWGVKGS